MNSLMISKVGVGIIQIITILSEMVIKESSSTLGYKNKLRLLNKSLMVYFKIDTTREDLLMKPSRIREDSDTF